MNRRLLVVVSLSLAACAAAVVLFVAGGGAHRTATVAVRPAPSGPTPAAATPLSPAEAAEAALANTTLRLGDAWKALDHGDLKALVANLRAAGFPPEVVRAVVGAMLHEQFAARQREILGSLEPPPYWKAGPLYSPAQLAALRQLSRDEQAAMRELLGPDSATSEMARYYQQRSFGNLSPDKVDALQRILSDYGDLRSQVYADAGNGGVMLPADREKLALLAKDQQDDIAALLTPDELRQYELRSSPTAQRLRSQLAYFNPTEQEFNAIYDLQSQFDQKYNMTAMMGTIPSPDYFRQRQADQAQLQSQIQATLGEPRFQQYQESTDPGFQAASRIVSSLQLPADNAAATWGAQKTFQQQLTAIRTDRSLVGAQRTEALAALDAQANQQLSTLLTQPGLDAYKQTAGGFWLRNLDQSPAVRRVVNSTAAGAATPPGGH